MSTILIFLVAHFIASNCLLCILLKEETTCSTLNSLLCEVNLDTTVVGAPLVYSLNMKLRRKRYSGQFLKEKVGFKEMFMSILELG